MDIYFCDLCGVRVTDVDLRGGHGIRRVDDVICATCLELGHGKEWLVQHNRPRQPSSTSLQPVESSKGTDTAALGARPAPSRPARAAAAAVKAKESPTLDAGRDRARTVEEDEPEIEPVAPRIIGDIDGIATAATVPDHEAEAEAASHGLDDEPVCAPANARRSDFAAAASGFSALGAQRAPQARHGAEDLSDDSGHHRELTAEEVEHHDDGADAEAGLETADGSAAEAEDAAKEAEGAETADGELRAGVADDTATAENEASGLSREDQEAATDENDPPEVPPMKTSEPPRRPVGRPGGGRPNGPPASSARTPAGRQSTGRIPTPSSSGRPGVRPGASSAKNLKAGNSSSKNATAKSGKGAKASVRTKRKADNKKVMIISAITISLMIIIMIAVSVSRAGHHGAQKVESVNISKELREHIGNAKKQAQSALDSKDVEQLKSAKAAILTVGEEVETFSQYAKTHGRSQDDIDREVELAGMTALNSLKMNIGHEIAKQSVH
jgi:hypothetical protein